jgi:hypothetical protein
VYNNTFLIADLHLTTNPLDYYKWDFFEWLISKIEIHKIEVVNILGDLTEKKDNHSSLLVNKLTSYLELLLYAGVKQIRILKGNHDFINEDTPFFEFLNVSPKIHFITTPTRLGTEFFYPYTTDYDLQKYADEINKCQVLYMHTQVKGTKLLNGKVLEEGITQENFKGIEVAKIYSGHIHYFTSTRNDILTYVGSQYPVYFGDEDRHGAVFHLYGGEPSEKLLFYLDSPGRYNVKFENEYQFSQWLSFATKEKDQLKVTFELDRCDYDKWPDLRKTTKELCKERKLELVSLTLKPNKDKKFIGMERNETVVSLSYDEVLDRFATKEKLTDDYIAIAREIINANS